MNFSTTSAVVLTGVVVTVGKWTRHETLSVRLIVGGTFLAIGLAALSEMDEGFGQAMAMLVLVAALFEYGTSIAKATGMMTR